LEALAGLVRGLHALEDAAAAAAPWRQKLKQTLAQPRRRPGARRAKLNP
ncbi:MAG: hypothetical protein JO303_11560, partial [Caulobacteraceae bacterium]|nr:hypothetical protein [Caulobacteraceae bacterium]